MEGLDFDRIGDMERVWLERKFEREEYFKLYVTWKGTKL